MKIVIHKILPGAVLIHGVVLPQQNGPDARGVGLLPDALGHCLTLGVANLGPAVQVGAL